MKKKKSSILPIKWSIFKGLTSRLSLHFPFLLAASLPSVLIVLTVLCYILSLSHLTFILRPLLSSASLIICVEIHKTILTAHSSMYMLTCLFQGRQGFAHDAQITYDSFSLSDIQSHNPGICFTSVHNMTGRITSSNAYPVKAHEQLRKNMQVDKGHINCVM